MAGYRPTPAYELLNLMHIIEAAGGSASYFGAESSGRMAFTGVRARG
jgi:hypothetical protein